MLRKSVFAFLSIVLSSGSVAAADIDYAPVEEAFSWSGFYIGAHIGGAWGDVDVLELDDEAGEYNAAGNSWGYDADGVFGGAQIGVNWQPSSLLLGIEADIGLLGIDGDAPDPASPGLDTISSVDGGFYATVTGRVGLAMDRLLIYGKGGVAFADLGAEINDSCSLAPCGPATISANDDGIETGWTAGGGVEWAFTERMSAKLEYLFMSFDDVKVSGIAPGFVDIDSWEHDVDLHTVKFGINWHF
jgi:outer membrane immunogenic protein